MRRPLKLERLIDDELGSRPFGGALSDFTRLCRNLSWDYPNGLILINTDRKRTVLFQQDCHFYEPSFAPDINQALTYMMRTPGLFGIIAQRRKNVFQFSLFAMMYFEEHGDAHLRARAEAIIALVDEWA